MSAKRAGAVAVLVTSTIGLFGLAGSNHAADPGVQGSEAKSGAEVFEENCSTCHETKPHFDAAKLDAIRQHMQQQVADLSPQEQEAILAFLRSN